MRSKQVERYLKVLNKVPFDAFEEILSAASKMDVPVIEEETGFFLDLLVRIKRPKKVLEIGTGISLSSHFILSADPECRLVTVDSNKSRVELARKRLIKSGFGDRIAVLNIDIFSYFDMNTEIFDMILLDSAKSDYLDLTEICLQHLNIDGLLIADNILSRNRVSQAYFKKANDEETDIFPDYVKKLETFNALMSNSEKVVSRFFGIRDGIMVSIKKKCACL